MSSVSTLWRRFKRWARKLDEPTTLTEPQPLPFELTLAFDEHQDALSTWTALAPAERGALASFVASAKCKRRRAHRADTVAKWCDAGLEAIRDWMAMNRAMLAGGTLGPPGWTG